MIKTFIFDLGNVIVPFDFNNSLEPLREICGAEAEKILPRVVSSEENRLFETGKLSSREFFETLRDKFNLDFDFEQFVRIWNSIFSPEPLLGEKLFESLSGKYRLLILSDTNEVHFKFIKENYPVMRFFDDFILSCETGFYKPAPEMFRTAVEKARCLPTECFFTDDKKENTDRAREFGIDAVQFLSASQLRSELKKRNLPI